MRNSAENLEPTEDVTSVKSDSNHTLEVVHEKTTWADRVKNKKIATPKVQKSFAS